MTHTDQRPPACLSPETLAAFLDGTLDADSRARAERHLHDCQDCYEAMVMAAAMSDDVPAAPAAPAAPATGRGAWQGWTIGLATAAAVIVVALVAVSRWAGGPATRPELRELVAAADGTRPVEGRLTGRFPWAPPPSAMRGAAADVRPEIAIAAARLQQAVERERTASSLAAFGTSRLFRGEPDAAVAAFEEALSLDRGSAEIWSDTASAYLARGATPARAADLPRALEAAATAIALSPDLPEAWFNKALALERLFLRPEAIAAWEQYLTLDADSPWAGEARSRLEALRKTSAGAASLDAHPLREELYDVALPAWAATLAGAGGDSGPAADRAAALVAQISRLSEDAFSRAAAEHVDSLRAAPELRRRTLAEAYAAYARARAAYALDGFEAAAPEFQRAREGFAATGSPMALQARLHEAILAYRRRRCADASAVLAGLRARADERFWSLRGRIDWVDGLCQAMQARTRDALALYGSALAHLGRAREPSNEAFVHGLMSTQYDMLGDPMRSWPLRLRAFEGSRRQGPLLVAAAIASGQAWHRAAAIFAEASAAASREAGRPTTLADALRWRAIIAARQGDPAGARAYLADARAVIADRSDDAWDRIRAETDLATAAVADADGVQEGIAAATRALAYFERGSAGRLPEIYQQRARLHRLAGDVRAAEDDLRRGVAQLAQTRAYIDPHVDQATFTDVVRRLVDDLVSLLVARGAADEAFAAVDAVRARDVVPAHGAAPMTVAALQAVVPRDALLIVFVVGDRDSYAWGVRRGQARVERIDAGREVLARLVAAAAPPREEAGSAARLRQLLLAPFDAMLAGEDLLVLVPDGPLHALAFAALPGRRARFIVEEHPILIAPSAGAWQQASQQLAARRPDRPRVLAIGNPAIPASVVDLPDLPHADAEARVVAGIYDAQPLIGAAATRAAVVDGLQRADIVHFAGHAVVDAVHPLASRLVIADPAGAGLTGGDIRGLTLRRARLVVLSACETVGGMSTRSEGPIGLARAFLAAGAPAIVASHWVAADRAARELFEQFHRAFAATGDAARSLRVAQRHLMSSGDPALAAPAAWAGFVAIGGGPPPREEIR